MTRDSWFFLLGWACAVVPIASAEEPGGLSFRKEIAPVFVQKCLICHDREKAKGGYRMDTFANILRGGKSKEPAVVPGESARSKLYALVIAEDPDDRMPQKDEPLPAEIIGRIKEWIAQGAPFDGPNTNALLVQYAERPPHPAPPEHYAYALPVLALAAHPKEIKLATSGYHELLVFQGTNHSVVQRITNIAQRVYSLAYSPAGDYLAAGTGNPGILGECVLVPDKNMTPRLVGRMPDVVLAVAFTPDGKLLAAGGADFAIHIYDVETGVETQLIQQHADWVMDLKWDGAGKRIISASRDRTARIYDAATGELQTTYTGHNGPVYAVAVGPEDKIISAGRDDKSHVWSMKEGKKGSDLDLGKEIYRLQFWDGLVYSAGGDTIRIAELDGTIRAKPAGHRDVIYALAIATNANCFYTGSYDGEVRRWELKTGRFLGAFTVRP